LTLFFLLAVVIVWCAAAMLAVMHAPLMDEDVPAPTSPGLRPEEAERPTLPEGYVEPKRTYELRAAFVARVATRAECLAHQDQMKVRALIRDAGGC
jgi:hypothetical protein